MLDDDAEMEKVWKSQYSLQEMLTDPKEWKSYDQLKARLDKVLGAAEDKPKTTVETIKAEAKKAPKEKVLENAYDEPEPALTEEDDDLAFFSKLADEE